MVFIEESDLKHILKTRQINRKQKRINDIFRKSHNETWIPQNIDTLYY